MAQKTKVYRLRKERIKRGWSQSHVYSLTGIAASDVSQLERMIIDHRLRPGWCNRLAKAFGMPTATLFAVERE